MRTKTILLLAVGLLVLALMVAFELWYGLLCAPLMIAVMLLQKERMTQSTKTFQERLKRSLRLRSKAL